MKTANNSTLPRLPGTALCKACSFADGAGTSEYALPQRRPGMRRLVTYGSPTTMIKKGTAINPVSSTINPIIEQLPPNLFNPVALLYHS